VIYRRHDRTVYHETQGRLVLLIVHENPGAGVHVQALENAIRLVTRWKGPENTVPDPTVRILGPTFSGSSDSLRPALSSCAVRRVIPRGFRVRVVSGSATDGGNKAAIERFDDPLSYDGKTKLVPVSFAATVNSDNLLLDHLCSHIVELGWSF